MRCSNRLGCKASSIKEESPGTGEKGGGEGRGSKRPSHDICSREPTKPGIGPKNMRRFDCRDLVLVGQSPPTYP